MFSLSYDRQLIFCALLFFVAGFISLYLESLWWMIFPFGWVIIQPIFSLAVNKTQTLFYLLIALLPLSTEVNITPTLGFDFPDEILMMLLTGIFFLKVVYKPSTFPLILKHHPLILVLILHLTWILISVYYSTDHWLSIKLLLAKIWFIVPFVILPVILLRSKKEFQMLALLLLYPMAFAVIQSLIRHAFYNFSFEGIKETMYPFFRNHVNYSAMLACLLPVAWVVNHLTPKTNNNKTWLQAGILISVVAVILAYSRGAWIALIIALLASWIIKRRLMKPVLLLIMIAATFAVCWLANNNHYLRFANDYNNTIFHKNFGEHLQATIQLKDVSNAERFYRWVAAANMIEDKPLTGFGPNTFYNNYKSYTITPFKTWVSNNPEHSTVHNYFLLLLIEQGIPGLVLFALLFFGMILNSQQLYHQFNDPFYKTIALTIGVVLTMIGALIFMSDLIETDKIGSLFWLCLGSLIVLKQRLKDEKQLKLIL